jgi:hypothetical protein
MIFVFHWTTNRKTWGNIYIPRKKNSIFSPILYLKLPVISGFFFFFFYYSFSGGDYIYIRWTCTHKDLLKEKKEKRKTGPPPSEKKRCIDNYFSVSVGPHYPLFFYFILFFFYFFEFLFISVFRCCFHFSYWFHARLLKVFFYFIFYFAILFCKKIFCSNFFSEKSGRIYVPDAS